MKTVSKPRFIRASGAPFSDEDAQLIGAELVKIAAAHKVCDLRLLDKKLVFAAVEADPEHPLRRFYDWNDKSAARKHRVDFTHRLMMNVRLDVRIGKFHRPLPISISVEIPGTAQGIPRRQRVLTEDALRNDPVFASAMGVQVRNIENALSRAEALAAAGRPPAEISMFLEEVRAAFDNYKSTLVSTAS